MSSVSGLDHQRFLPASLEARLVGYMGRVGGCALLLTIALLWASVLSWSVSDPSLMHATGETARNYLGTPGAIASDLLLQTLGLAAAIALLAPMLWGLELVGAERVQDFRSKAAYFPLSVLLLAGALSSLPTLPSWPLEHGFGGILGDVVYNFGAAIFSLINAERAGAASGVLFFITGVAALANGLDIKLRDLVALGRLKGKQPGRAPVDDWHPGLPPQLAWTTRLRTGASSLMARLATSRHPAAKTSYAQGAHVAFDNAPQARHQAPHQSHHQGGRQLPAHFSDDDDHNDHYDEAPADAEASLGQVVPDHLIEDEPSIDFSSRAIAERFAPANGRPALAQSQQQPAQAPVEPTPVRAPAQRPQAKGLGGIAQRFTEHVYKRPQPAMLKRAPASKSSGELSQTVLRGTARLLEDVLADFGVKGEVRDIKPGPVVTLFELEPARGTKASRVMALSDDIARSMSATSARVAVVPGRNAIGIELPNARRDQVGLREILEHPAYAATESVLPLALGRSIGGDPVIADLARMPHLLVAGTTGSGKSVGVNAMILSILFRHTPEECRFLMIDPKMLELSVYNGIPHLLCPVVTEPQKAVGALNWAVNEMEERYKRMSRLSVRNIEAFNTRIKTAKKKGETLARTVQTGFDARTGQAIYEREEMDLEPMPYIVIVVDEFADLMITAGKDIETAVQRLAQKARAAGIHLIMATQRPSVDIITGTIKANFPTRLSFKVASKIDSRTILNEQGAEQLLGQGDMLFALGSGQMVRVHGPFVSDEEVETVTDHLRRQGEPRYIDGIGVAKASQDDTSGGAGSESGDSLYDRAVAVVLRDRKASTSYVQRRLSIGYNRAADLIERMEREGLISAPNQTGRREILAGDGSAHAASA
jgi:S-DNA-T family DNA segregation ATPase FtsK/SpoIIIE